MTATPTEPTYYVCTAFSGVGFMLPGREDVTMIQDPTFVKPEQVDPTIREQGREWMAEYADFWRTLLDDGELTFPS